MYLQIVGRRAVYFPVVYLPGSAHVEDGDGALVAESEDEVVVGLVREQRHFAHSSAVSGRLIYAHALVDVPHTHTTSFVPAHDQTVPPLEVRYRPLVHSV